MFNIPIVLNPFFWLTCLVPRPFPAEEPKEYLWEMEFNEVYNTRIKSTRLTEEEAQEECYNLFNVHSSSPVRVKFDTNIKRLK